MESRFANETTATNLQLSDGGPTIEDPASLIDYILEQRKPYLRWLYSTRQYLTALHAELMALAQFTRSLSEDSFFQTSLADLDFDRLAARTSDQQAFLEILGRRFERETLNIAVVGMANQGKSFLLRTISGLPQTVIPDRDNQHKQLEPLTGARSTIFHQAGGDVRGRVVFHSESSLLEILNKYRQLLKTSISHPPPVFDDPFASLDDVLQRRFPEPADDQAALSRYKVLLKELHKYLELLAHHRNYIGRSPMSDLGENDIATFVTQADGKKTSDQKRLYLAVDEVQITCPFQYDEVGKIALIDLPGLGEATLGGPERLMAALKFDADIALFVWRPVPGNLSEGHDIINLYDTCYQALADILPLQEWSYLVLNHHKGIDNYKHCREMLDKIESKQVAYRFFDQDICDCSSREEVQEKVLKPILHHLATHIGALDRRLTQTFFNAVQQLVSDTDALLQRVQSRFAESPESWEEIKFGELFRSRWEDLQETFNALVGDLVEKANEPDPAFEQKVEALLDECEEKAFLPSVVELEEQVSAKRFDKALIDQMIWTRATLADKLRPLDTALDQPLETVKEEVVRVLITAGGFVGAGQQGLTSLRETIAPAASPLKDALDVLLNFNLSARGLVGRKIRAALQTLEPRRHLGEETLLGQQLVYNQATEAEVGEPKIFTPVTTRDHRANNRQATAMQQAEARPEALGAMQIRETLEAIVSRVLGDIKTSLNQDYCLPNQVAYTAVSDFVDSIIYTRNIEDHWRNVYRRLRAEVWPENYEVQKVRSLQRSELLALAEKMQHLIRSHSLFLPG
jgi:hypothetical protein